MALEGNLAAMRFVVERTRGRSPEAPREAFPLDISLPSLETAAGCTAAIDRLLAAMCQGTVNQESAQVLVDVIMARLKAIEVNELEGRLTELENAATTVDLPGSLHLRRRCRGGSGFGCRVGQIQIATST